jgi:hypothetical protein
MDLQTFRSHALWQTGPTASTTTRRTASCGGVEGNTLGSRRRPGLADEEMPSRILDELVRMISSRWTRGYEVLGPATTTAGLIMAGISVAEMLASTMARAIILYAQRGPSSWMLAAAWGTAFQVVSLPVHWALECGERHRRIVAHHMDSRVGGVDLPTAGGGPADSGRNAGPVRRLLQCSGGVCRGSCFLS